MFRLRAVRRLQLLHQFTISPFHFFILTNIYSVLRRYPYYADHLISFEAELKDREPWISRLSTRPSW